MTEPGKGDGVIQLFTVMFSCMCAEYIHSKYCTCIHKGTHRWVKPYSSEVITIFVAVSLKNWGEGSPLDPPESTIQRSQIIHHIRMHPGYYIRRRPPNLVNSSGGDGLTNPPIS